ncbi:PrpR N-terminal domain-containing protein [Oceanobacillus jeddahense]|uniref:PrpR N-terminal domain-containing protein n=1 Tax=Oceanobacillus jeddahense TaxID=1462527 RepID=A0ABY5JTD1_9BACI|nr:PrpR N-terminal domain-containing protein [Oceanobacillus jeddahense]UUI02438.1 PrpR N-terminal domain-containing protein [Oceanobacillus jeddahense]
MASKLIMTAGYPELTELINIVAEELGLKVTIVEGILTEAAEKVKDYVENGNYEVAISRAGTAQEVKEAVDIPVVHHDSDEFDILQGFVRAKQLGDKICFITYPEDGFLFNFDDITNTIGFDVTILTYKTPKELVDQVEKAKKMGMEVVLGGGMKAAEIAEEYGLKSMYLTASKRSIRRMLILANKVAEDRIKLKEEAE